MRQSAVLSVLMIVMMIMAATVNAELEVSEEFSAQATSEGDGMSAFHRLTTDEDGLLIACGSFDQNLQFDGIDGPLEVAGAFGPGPNLMCARFNDRGEALWVVPLSYRAGNDTYAPLGISAVSAVLLGDDNTFFVSASFQSSVYIPCSSSGSQALCTSTVPQGEDSVPAIVLTGRYLSASEAFYAKFSVEDGGAIWAFKTSDHGASVGASASDGSSLFVSGSIVAMESVTVPSVPEGIEGVSTVTFECDYCSFVCSIMPSTGGAEWCKPIVDWELRSMTLGDGGTALYASGFAYEVGDHNNTAVILTKLSVEEEGQVLWMAESDEDMIEQWMPAGTSCYNDCQSVYVFGSYQYNSTFDNTGALNGFVWAVDQGGNEQWLSTISDDSHLFTLVSGVESADGLYVAGSWLDGNQGSFIKTLDYNDGKVLQESDINTEALLTDSALVDFSMERATFGFSGTTTGDSFEAFVGQVGVIPGVEPVYPSASASPMPSPVPSPPVQQPGNSSYSSGEDDGPADDDGGEGEDDDDDWIWWVIGILAVCGIVLALIVVVVGGVVYRRRMLVQQAQEDPYDYDMLSKDMFDD